MSEDKSDICERLRSEIAWEPEIGDLLREAAEEIDRLRGYRDEAESQAAIASLAVARLRITDAEREAVREAAGIMEEMWDNPPGPQMVATLKGLLERTQ